ncbi:MAG TPA: FAD-dependent monooxygenase [Rhodanobacteraceae bacterium]|nr:FAD-dependent monooxygenase [Rhodanobacteraceae bacterium]
MPDRVDILIVGGGLVGTSLALALDAIGRKTALVDIAPPRIATVSGDDDRNLALARASVNALSVLGVWPLLEASAGTIRRVEVSRAGEFGRVRMSAEEAGVDALGRVVPGSRLGASLERRLAACRNVQRLAPATLEKLEPIASREHHDVPHHLPGAARLPPSPQRGEGNDNSARSGIRASPTPEREEGSDNDARGRARLSPSPPWGEGWGEGVSGCSGWRACIATTDGERDIDARLVVGADGSDSFVRSAVGIGAQTHDYHQSLFVCTVSCEREVPDCAYERFTDDGPIALLPLPNQRRGLVLTVTADRHDEVAAMDDAAFLAFAQARFGWKLGRLSRPGKRFPHRIRRVLADSVTAPRAVLVGNAAQTVHPVGAQGFNLGLRDALTLADLIDGADDPGAPALLQDYARRRQPDREGVLAFSHGLVALGCLAQPMIAPFRSLAMLTLGGVPSLRHIIARRGMGFRDRPPVAALEAGP